jgi:murein DD-endopeptidase MepM/ murein hydrolase activator NlpD
MDFKSNTKIASIFQLSFRKLVLFLLLISFINFIPSTTHANVWSSVVNIFSGNNVSAQAESFIGSSSQNMVLPEPANNFDPAVKSAANIIIDGGEALLPESGPSNKAPDEIDNSTGQISTYIVRSGDTLAEIAEMFDVSVNTILWANDMTRSSVLKVGQTLVILPISGVMHTVVKGDTLNSIAKKYGGDLAEISSFNDLNTTSKLAIGDTIMIPDGQVSSSIRPSISIGSSGSNKIVSAGSNYSGYYDRPVIGGTRTQGIHGYNAVDISAKKGTSIFAAADGQVVLSKNSGWNGGYGQYIVISHSNGTQTLYAHLDTNIVFQGSQVKQGQKIGTMGNTGKVIAFTGGDGTHLHFEIRGAKNPF